MRARYIVAAAALALSVGPADASNVQGGYVTGFATLGSNITLVFTDGARATPPACSNPNYANRWALDATTPQGQATLSVLLTARALHEHIYLEGTGTCSVLGDSETINVAVTNNLQ